MSLPNTALAQFNNICKCSEFIMSLSNISELTYSDTAVEKNCTEPQSLGFRWRINWDTNEQNFARWTADVREHNSVYFRQFNSLSLLGIKTQPLTKEKLDMQPGFICTDTTLGYCLWIVLQCTVCYVCMPSCAHWQETQTERKRGRGQRGRRGGKINPSFTQNSWA